jgi:hypothetical protein
MLPAIPSSSQFLESKVFVNISYRCKGCVSWRGFGEGWLFNFTKWRQIDTWSFWKQILKMVDTHYKWYLVLLNQVPYKSFMNSFIWVIEDMWMIVEGWIWYLSWNDVLCHFTWLWSIWNVEIYCELMLMYVDNNVMMTLSWIMIWLIV